MRKAVAATSLGSIAGCGGGPEDKKTGEQEVVSGTDDSYNGGSTEPSVERTEELTEVEITEGTAENTHDSKAYSQPRPDREPDFEDSVTATHPAGPLPTEEENYRLSSGPADDINGIQDEDPVPGYHCGSDVVFELLSGEDESGVRDTINEATLTPDNLDVMLEDTENNLLDIYIHRSDCENNENGFAVGTYHIEIYLTS